MRHKKSAAGAVTQGTDDGPFPFSICPDGVAWQRHPSPDIGPALAGMMAPHEVPMPSSPFPVAATAMRRQCPTLSGAAR